MDRKQSKKCLVGSFCGIFALCLSYLIILFDERIAIATTKFFLDIGINPREEALVCIGIWAVFTFVVGYIIGVVIFQSLLDRKQK